MLTRSGVRFPGSATALCLTATAGHADLTGDDVNGAIVGGPGVFPGRTPDRDGRGRAGVHDRFRRYAGVRDRSRCLLLPPLLSVRLAHFDRCGGRCWC